MSTSSIWMIALAILCFGGLCPASGGTGEIRDDSSTKCEKWKIRVLPLKHPRATTTPSDGKTLDIEFDFSSEPPFSSLSQDEVLTGIKCLLELKGNRNTSQMTGASRVDLGTTFENPEVQIAALYFISYLFYQKYDHASAAVIVDRAGKWNTNAAVESAYAAYRKWYNCLRQLGLDEARKQKLDPLAGSGLRWY